MLTTGDAARIPATRGKSTTAVAVDGHFTADGTKFLDTGDADGCAASGFTATECSTEEAAAAAEAETGTGGIPTINPASKENVSTAMQNERKVRIVAPVSMSEINSRKIDGRSHLTPVQRLASSNAESPGNRFKSGIQS